MSKAADFARTAATGERIRLDEQIQRVRDCLDALAIGLRTDTPVLEAAQVVSDSASRLVSAAARLDAYDRVAREGDRR